MNANPIRDMSADTGLRLRSLDARLIWLPIIAAALLLYVPAYLDVARSLTSDEAGVQQPICLAIWLWVISRNREVFSQLNNEAAHSITGWVAICTAALMYAVGRSQEFLQLEIGSQLLFFVGAVLILLRAGSLSQLWFPALFLAFLVPVPGSLLNALLVPLKKTVSSLVADLLYRAGLPIARDGVVLYVGHYQLLIADACSGLNSMISLSAIGFLYVYIAGYHRKLPNILLMAAVLPIAFLANVTRVAALVLTTYHWGDEAGRGLHDYAAVAEILLVFGAFLVLDRIIRIALPDATPRPEAAR